VNWFAFVKLLIEKPVEPTSKLEPLCQ